MKTQHRKAFSQAVTFSLLTALGLLFAISPVHAQDKNGKNKPGSDECEYKPARGIVSTVSNYNFATTLNNVRNEISARPLNVFNEIDHQANAKGVDIKMDPTTVIIFGNPAIGAQIMQDNQIIGLELPLKILVWEDACNTVRVDYSEPSYMKWRFEVKGVDDVFNTMTGALNGIATAATE